MVVDATVLRLVKGFLGEYTMYFDKTGVLFQDIQDDDRYIEFYVEANDSHGLIVLTEGDEITSFNKLVELEKFLKGE